MTGSSRKYDLVNNQLCLTRVFFEIHAQRIAYGSLHRAYHLIITELSLCLALKLRLHDLYRHHGGKTLAEIVAGNINLDLFKHLAVLGILLKRRGKTAAETGQMSTALNSVYIVYKRIYVFVVSGIISESHFHRYALTLGVQMDDIAYERLFVGVDILYKFFQTGLAVKHLTAVLTALRHLTSVGKRKSYAGVKISEVTQTIGQCGIVIYGNGKYTVIRPERYARSGSRAFSYHGKIGCRFTA